MVVGDRDARRSMVNEEQEHPITPGNPLNAYVCVSHDPVSVSERCAQQKTSGVVDKRRYVHEFRVIAKWYQEPGISNVLCGRVAHVHCNRKVQRNFWRHWNARHGFRHLERALRRAQKATIPNERSWTTARPMCMSPCAPPRGHGVTSQPGRGPQLQRVFTENP
jgi:hypothetical protein